MLNGQVENHASSELLKRLFDYRKKPALFTTMYFNASHLGEEEDVADVRKVSIWAEGPHEIDE